MFVGKTKYDESKKEALRWQHAFYNLQAKWNDLVNEVNAKGGQQFLDQATLKPSAQLTVKELREIRVLCHPDKHGSSDRANEVTKKLNALIG